METAGFWDNVVDFLNFAGRAAEVAGEVATAWAGYNLSGLTNRSLVYREGQVPYGGQDFGSFYVPHRGQCFVWLGSRFDNDFEFVVVDRQTGNRSVANHCMQKEACRITVAEINLSTPGQIDYVIFSNKCAGEYLVGVIVDQ